MEEDCVTKAIALFICLLFLLACGERTEDDQRGIHLEKASDLARKTLDLDKEKEKLLETDRLFSKASEEKGFAGAFDLFTAQGARIFQNKRMPIEGKEAIIQFLADNVKGTVTWEPYFVEMSASADLAYTLGKSQSIRTSPSGKKVVSYGHYVTIWKKQTDGSWKLVFDTGIETPE